MAVVDLSDLPIRHCVITPVDFGAPVEPATGGRRTWVDRMGSRWLATFETPPMRIEPDARLWLEKLNRARRLGAVISVEQPGLNVGTPGSPVVRADTPTGRVIPLKGLTPNYAIKSGTWISIIVDGQRYLDQVTAQVIANGSGEADVPIQNLIREPLSTNDVVEISLPKIEGALENLTGGDWTVERVTSFTFTVTEEG